MTFHVYRRFRSLASTTDSHRFAAARRVTSKVVEVKLGRFAVGFTHHHNFALSNASFLTPSRPLTEVDYAAVWADKQTTPFPHS
jgi:hypothetical protein